MSPHQCVHCSEIYPDAAQELLKGCKCGSHFFFYIRQEFADKLQSGEEEMPIEFKQIDKQQIEKDVREIVGAVKEDEPIILDLESVRITGPGKFELDIVNLFSKKRPLIYKLEEGKYIIDLAASFNMHKEGGVLK